MRTDKTQAFIPFPVVGTMLTPTSIISSLLFAVESINSHARPVIMWLLSELDIVLGPLVQVTDTVTFGFLEVPQTSQSIQESR